ncbi:transmembrane amino acid transporter protein, putative [Plasmodium ovale wallikeri]|uniref:Transmembrane amino acid transporter protein, putative n=1 Tax=Plasmodium ovale wallikeri TaxID=864142 RepID=A0A1A8Z152_PLAOA|nr:transmembrane amino acid transporter protein, putative [Plasmodium ovale wallikeri]SBT38341.1 transmembrane amino acid transporter protein, putative [Plasmodium ovale wallikeri]
MNENGIVTNHYNLNKEKGKTTNKGKHKKGKKNDEYRNSLNHGNTSNYLEENVNNTHTSINSNIKNIFSSNKKKEKKSKNKKKYSTVGEGNANMGVKYFKTSPYMNLGDNDYGNNCGNHYGNEGSSEVGRSGKRGTQENYNGSTGQVNSDNDNITVVDVEGDKDTEVEETGEGKKKKKKKNWKRRTFSPFTPGGRRLTKSAYRSVLLQIIFYTLFGMVGYLSFLDTTKDNIILNYEDSNISILFCKFLLSVTFFFSVPLNFMGSYSSMLSLYLSGRNRFQKFYLFIFSRNRYIANLSTLLRDDTANPFEENTRDDLTENSSTAESQTEDKDQRKLISICATIVCALIAFNVRKLSNVIGIGGGITSSLISCLLPNLIYYKNRNNIKSKSKRYLTLAMLCFFSFMGFFSVIITSLILIF